MSDKQGIDEKHVNDNAETLADSKIENGLSSGRTSSSTLSTTSSDAFPDESFRAPDELLNAQALANLLDTAVRIPFVGIKVGLDFLIGLIPGVGDTLMLLASLRIVYLGKKMNLPKPLMHKMIRNAVIDYGLGFIPIVGDIIDLFFKANQRNVRIMEQYWVAENKDIIDAIAKRKYEEWERNNKPE
ncbi:DUF4112 domain-containing protein [Agaribacter marinus]|uniref:DUF4112 domain-containing protein n=1 Tax=Agaribacter marinus TaxID=1431249 RepID=A0AA37SZ18_9ALTE|nr:hypothetical protein GCM10007852_27500 [Agaribacter marinus]